MPDESSDRAGINHAAVSSTGSVPDTPAALAWLLLRASRWFDRQLLDRLEEQGWPRLTSAQSLVFPHLGGHPLSPSSLARALGVTRQSTHELVTGLVRLGLLELRPASMSSRQRRVVLTDDGQRLAADARRILHDLEQELAVGLDRAAVADLRRLLSAQVWSGPPRARSAGTRGDSGA